MSEVLETLKALNPDLPLYSVFDPEFQPFGRVIQVPEGEGLLQKVAETPLPETGNHYRGSVESLEQTAAFRFLQETVFGGMEAQAGFCNGFGHRLNAFEYHKCPEVNASPTGLVLLLARFGDLKNGRIPSDRTAGFYLPKNVFIEIDPLVLHFAPCRLPDSPFKCLVALTKHTNEPIERPSADSEGEARLLFMRNKWLVFHPDSPQAANGAFVGIEDENITLQI